MRLNIRAGTASLLVLAVAGCGSAADTSATAAAVPSASLSPSTLASQVALVNGDLTHGGTVALMPAGDQVKHQVTLDFCGYHFSTETHRIARLQVDVLTAAGTRTGASNEVAVYDSEAQAAKALNEFRASVKGCRKDVYQRSAVAGVPKLRYDLATLSTSASLPVHDNAVTSTRVAAKGISQRLYEVIIFQRRGAVLTGVYLNSQAPATTADLAAAQVLAIATGKHLASA